MRKFFPLYLFSLATLILGSCSHFSDVAITKRHYRNGYYVERFNTKHGEALKDNKNVPDQLSQNPSPTTSLKSSSNSESDFSSVKVSHSKESKTFEAILQKKALRNANELEMNPAPETKESSKASFTEGIRMEKSGYKARGGEAPPLGRLLWIIVAVLLILLLLSYGGGLLGSLFMFVILILVILLLLRLLRIL